MKCLVRLCPNDDRDGRFEGSVCAPCATVLKGTNNLASPSERRILASVFLGSISLLDHRDC